ncbi:hypothetical protein TNCV_569271 [Trichonephila clavipes]|nr:hypothetical protein TNCV_569271 [Trichonephila clavipes]
MGTVVNRLRKVPIGARTKDLKYWLQYDREHEAGVVSWAQNLVPLKTRVLNSCHIKSVETSRLIFGLSCHSLLLYHKLLFGDECQQPTCFPQSKN